MKAPIAMADATALSQELHVQKMEMVEAQKTDHILECGEGSLFGTYKFGCRDLNRDSGVDDHA
jgi:hypothetical protein